MLGAFNWTARWMLLEWVLSGQSAGLMRNNHHGNYFKTPFSGGRIALRRSGFLVGRWKRLTVGFEQ